MPKNILVEEKLSIALAISPRGLHVSKLFVLVIYWPQSHQYEAHSETRTHKPLH